MSNRGFVLFVFLVLLAIPATVLADKLSKEEFLDFYEKRLEIKAPQDCKKILSKVVLHSQEQERFTSWDLMARVVCQYSGGDVVGAFSGMNKVGGFILGSPAEEYISPVRREMLDLLLLQNTTSFKRVLEQNGFKHTDQYFYAPITPSNFDQCKADKDCSRLIPKTKPSETSFDIWIVMFPKKGGEGRFHFTAHFEGDYFVDFGYMNNKQWKGSVEMADSKKVDKKVGQMLKAGHIKYLASLPWKWSALTFDSGEPLEVLKWEK